MKHSALIILLGGALFAQAPSPVQTGITPNPNGSEPIFRVEVTSKSVRAVNYHNRQGTDQNRFSRHCPHA